MKIDQHQFEIGQHQPDNWYAPNEELVSTKYNLSY